jgi:hypothetical protein
VDEDAFKLVEVTGAKLPETAAPAPLPAAETSTPGRGAAPARSGSLAIIEAEVYEPLR